jgi:dimethylargininase
LPIALTRDVSPNMGRCELTYLPRVAIDLDLAREQHRQYRQALTDLGCEVVNLSAARELPDAVFIEDTTIVVDEVAIVTRPGAASRRAETASVTAKLGEYRPVKLIEPPGTVDGGDVLQAGRTIYVGLSGRTDKYGARQLRDVLTPHGYQVKAVEVRGCLHLKSAVTQVAVGTLLINPAWVDRAAFDGLSFIEVDPAEPFAGNGLLVGTTVIYPNSFPLTCERLRDRGMGVLTVDISELQKAEGGVTCCSIILNSAKVRV